MAIMLKGIMGQRSMAEICRENASGKTRAI